MDKKPNTQKNKIQRNAAYKKLTLALKTRRLRVKRWKKVFEVSGIQIKSRSIYAYIRQNRI